MSGVLACSMMSRFHPWLLIGLMAPTIAAQDFGDPMSGSDWTAGRTRWTADEIMERVRRTLPREPWQVRAELICRDRHDVLRQTYRVDLWLDWAGTPPSARIQLADAFGVSVVIAEIRRVGEGRTEVQWRAADDAGFQPARLSDPVADSGLTWADLTLDFLWWSNGRVLGMEMKRGRECYRIELESPCKDPYTKVCVWVDAREQAMLQAEGYDGPRLVRRVRVKSLRKTEHGWMVEDFELESPVEGTRAILRVLDSGPAPARERGGP